MGGGFKKDKQSAVCWQYSVLHVYLILHESQRDNPIVSITTAQQ